MEVIGQELLEDFKRKNGNIRGDIDTWFLEVSEAKWVTPEDIKRKYSAASFLGNNNVIFNIKGNRYRILIKVNYKNNVVLIRKVGTHAEYDKWRI